MNVKEFEEIYGNKSNEIFAVAIKLIGHLEDTNKELRAKLEYNEEYYDKSLKAHALEIKKLKEAQ